MPAGFSGMLSLGAAAVTLAVILLRVTRWQEARALLAGGGFGSPLVGRSTA
ncbi:hypothetical protein [Nocardia asiatica]|uniref:hypothetical protein n=1 Tax=Nocardia asiatica TaxID=209252 RepID=UPI003EE03A55